MADKTAIRFEQVTKEFASAKSKVNAVKDVSLTVDRGEIYGIIGFSGAGKSTLVRMINGLEKPTSGEVVVDGKNLNALSKKDLRALRKNIGMVFQQFNLLESKPVYDNVAMPLILNNTAKQEIESRVKELLEFVELSDKVDSYPSHLSGGQKQRVGIARALATNPDILLCDEATSALDPKTTDSILELLKRINQDFGITIVIITHEMHVIQKICDKVAVMDAGYVVEQGDVKEVFSNPKEEITKGFVGMIVKEEIPESLQSTLDLQDQKSQIWSVKYWGENRTIDLVEDIRKGTGAKVRLLSTSTNPLRADVLNVLILEVRSETDISEQLKKALEPYNVLLERKSYV